MLCSTHRHARLCVRPRQPCRSLHLHATVPGSSQVVVLGEVGDEGHGHTHVDAGSDRDGQHGQEQGPPGAGAGLVEVPFGHCFVRLQGRRGRRQRKEGVTTRRSEQMTRELGTPPVPFQPCLNCFRRGTPRGWCAALRRHRALAGKQGPGLLLVTLQGSQSSKAPGHPCQQWPSSVPPVWGLRSGAPGLEGWDRYFTSSAPISTPKWHFLIFEYHS